MNKKAEIQDKFDSASLLLYRRSDIEKKSYFNRCDHIKSLTHVCLHEATHMYVRVCAYVCECESYKSPKYKDVFKKDQELFK